MQTPKTTDQLAADAIRKMVKDLNAAVSEANTHHGLKVGMRVTIVERTKSDVPFLKLIVTKEV